MATLLTTDCGHMLGRVNSSSILRPTHSMDLKEAIKIDNADYEKFKNYLLVNNKTLDFQIDNQRVLEAEKDRKFQTLFKELWPNLSERLTAQQEADKCKKSLTGLDLLNELEKNRAYYDLLVKKEIEDAKNKAMLASMSAAAATMPLLETARLSGCCHHTEDKCVKICLCNSSPCNSKIEINTKPATPSYIDTDRLLANHKEFLAHLKKTGTSYASYGKSSYNLPCPSSTNIDDFILKRCYTNEASLAKESQLMGELKEAHERLKKARKLEKATVVVDEIIGKVNLLQDEMKRKTDVIKLSGELEDIKKRQQTQCIERRLKELELVTCRERQKSLEHARVLVREREKSKEREKELERALERSRERVRSMERSSSRRRDSSSSSCHRSSSQERRITFSSDEPSFSVKCRREHHTHSHRPRSRGILKRSTSNSQGWHRVQPKVDCWNCNCYQTHDKNVY